MNATARSRGLDVAGGGTGIVSHAGLVLPHTKQVAERVFVLPNGTTLPAQAPAAIAQIIRRAAALA